MRSKIPGMMQFQDIEKFLVTKSMVAELSDSDIVGLNVPTGRPLVYELDAGLKPLKHYYLGDAAEIARAQAAVAAQGKAR